MNSSPLEDLRETPPPALPREDYEAPQIEAVLTPEEMAREVQYAGRPISAF